MKILHKIFKRVVALDLCQNFVSALSVDLKKFSTCIDNDEINVGIVIRKILQIYN